MPASTTTDAQRVARAFLDAIAGGDGDRLGELLSDDIIWVFPGDVAFSGVHRGKQAVFYDLFAEIARCFEPGHFSMAIHHVIADGALVAAEYTGRNLTNTGRRYENRYVFMIEVEDGLIRNVRSYCDTSYLKDLLSG